MEKTTKQVDKFKGLISNSNRIVITSHISPDPDAISSLLLLGTTLVKNFPDKVVLMVMEEEPIGLDFLEGYKDIKFTNLFSSLNEHQPDLLILLDGNNYSRASRQDAGIIRDFVKNKNVRTIIIDHHEPVGREESTDLFINRGTPATAQEIYELFKMLKFERPPGFAQTAMLGLYADSGGFAYLNNRHSDTFAMADDLVTAGANLEKIKNSLGRYSELDLKVFSELAANIGHKERYSFSFIGDEYVKEWLNSGNSPTQLHKGTEAFVNGFIRNIEDRNWGFIVYKNVLQGENVYSVSLRSLRGEADVSLIAGKLGGGGHKGAAGAKFAANSVEDALRIVQSVIAEADWSG